jgi:hypothetical protein
MLDVGDKIAVQFLPALNGSALGVLRSIILPDGRTYLDSYGAATD